LGFTILHITSDKSSMPPRQSLAELAQLNQAGAWIVLKVALSQPAKVGKLTIQKIQKLEITCALLHSAIFARNLTKLQRVIAYSNTPAALPSNIPASLT
jgi:hypothetical protein